MTVAGQEEKQTAPEENLRMIKNTIPEANLSDPSKQWLLARLYQCSNIENHVEALRWMRSAASLGEPNAQIALANLYQTGIAELSPNPNEAIKIYKKLLAEKHHLSIYQEATYGLASIYENAQNMREAISLYEEAATMRRVDLARNEIPLSCQNSLINPSPPNSTKRLALIYENGSAVSKNLRLTNGIELQV